MAGRLTEEDLRNILQTAGPLPADPFDVLSSINLIGSEPAGENIGRELLLRALDRRADFDSHSQLLNHLTLSYGLYPYGLPQSYLPSSALIAYEAHTPAALAGTSFVLNRLQAEVFRKLYAGDNVILSAPTSFGKSYVVEALVASGRWNNIVVVVPTIALMDEVRRRLARFHEYTLITHATQSFGDKNLVVSTQERLSDIGVLGVRADLAVIDEFYKLNDDARDPSRRDMLNVVVGSLVRQETQLYMTGPNIDGLAALVPNDFRAAFLATSFRTVAVNYFQEEIRPAETEGEALQRVVRQFPGPSLIYCRSKDRVRVAAQYILGDQRLQGSETAQDLAWWVAQTYDADWIVARALARGVGIHHAAIPRALGHAMVRLFNAGELNYLVCTSTLIEGVNTAAKNVVVLDDKLDRRPLDHFTFANISGRAGRSFRNFVGNVISFAEPPDKTEDLQVDLPVLSQSSNASLAQLLSLPEERLTAEGRSRLEPIFNQRQLSLATLRTNRAIDPEMQLTVAEQIEAAGPTEQALMDWDTYPTTAQMEFAAGLILMLTHSSSRSGMNKEIMNARLRALAINEADVPGQLPGYLRLRHIFPTRDDAVEGVLAFSRNWAGHHIPQKLRALQRIINDVHGRLGRRRVNYAFYATQVENLFLPAHMVTMEEYGLPYQTAQKLRETGFGGLSLDAMLASLPIAADRAESDILSRAERLMLDDTLAGLRYATLTNQPADGNQGSS